MTSSLLTTRQVAERLGVSPETVLRRVRSGQLPAVKLASNALRISEAALDEFLAARAYAVTQQATSIIEQEEAT